MKDVRIEFTAHGVAPESFSTDMEDNEDLCDVLSDRSIADQIREALLAGKKVTVIVNP